LPSQFIFNILPKCFSDHRLCLSEFKGKGLFWKIIAEQGKLSRLRHH